MQPRTNSRATWALIGALILLVGALALCFDRFYNGDFYLSLLGGRFVAEHGFVAHDPFPTVAQGDPWLNQQWLSQLAFFQVAGSIGLQGLTVVYALLLAAPLALLLWLCRSKGAPMLIAIAALYFPGLLAVIHPRAAGFTILAFTLLVGLIFVAWRARAGEDPDPRRMWLALIASVALFAVWANLHGGFVAGILLIALVTVGLTIDRWRGLETVPLARVALLALAGVLAVATVTLATPLGSAIWDYLLSFRELASAISHASEEWRSVFQSPLATAYVALAAAFAIWMWLRSPRPRRATGVLVAAGFVVFAALSLRNLIFIGPALAFQIAWSAPDRSMGALRAPIAVAGSAAVAAVLVWATVLGPPKAESHLGAPVVDYALEHPPENGRILTYAGVGSYMLWRSPDTPVVLNGWLEHFTRPQLADTYGVLRGWAADVPASVDRLGAGAVIAHVPEAIRRLEAHGFVAEFRSAEGTYLVRR
jgi:hypothetical protein